ncbi:LAQU0S21e00254g1_1 [Lachancea quebecensis]|uniref:MICOS complex subunit n=1 Tax=Lachancea quebecensis TaxID=1654605 RepID=A0A0P1KZJ1_9SACH|nr:LAQU0S21e00254g1_1 [Lachancea quebecensis]
MAPNFYRPVELVSEGVVPPEAGFIVSSEAKEAAPSHVASQSVTHSATEILGDNKLLDGISVRSPTYLNRFFSSWRLNLSGFVDNACDTIDEKSKKYYNYERKLTTTVANLHSDPRELLLPGMTYSLVAAMSGSVLTRNRNILARIMAPLALGAFCFSYVLPVTSSNTFGLLFDLEQQAFPRFAQNQRALYNTCKNTVNQTIAVTGRTSDAISGSFSKGMRLIKEWTGLNV